MATLQYGICSSLGLPTQYARHNTVCESLVVSKKTCAYFLSLLLDYILHTHYCILVVGKKVFSFWFIVFS